MRNSAHPMNLIIFALLASCALAFASSSKCDRSPEGSSANKSPPDGRYRLRIANDPVRYVPGETYNISLEGISRYAQATPHKFTGFFITVEKDLSDVRHVGFSNDDSVGNFHITAGAISKFSEKCQNLVTHTSSFPKNEVLVAWKAPPPGAGCVVFKSTVIEHRDVWYSDDGALSRVLCEDEADSGDTQPIVLDECTACDEAKYELTFEGLWSRHTHPKDFPDNGWLTKFSDVIGASHTTEFRFWTYGEPASEGLKELAEHASTQQLERELKDEGEHIRTIIKARGISYPNVTGKTFAVFRVDSEHHLVSLVSMISPSPDWFVGVSGLELCMSNGSWIEEKILNLYPYDAGTDSGPTYISSDNPTVPKEAIRRIKPNQPNDPRSPFHDSDNKEMKPLARLYLTRQRLYEKNCENQEANQDQDNQQESQPSGKNDCATTPWSEWTECDTTCGRGRKTRERNYRNPQAAEDKGCSKKLFDEKECQGAEETCNDEETATEETRSQHSGFDPDCTLTEWSEFSECSKECGKGQRTRTRDYVNTKHRKRCQKRYPEKLEEQEDCEGSKCSGNLPDDANGHKKNQKRCNQLSRYSPWTPCSAKCGIGMKMRVRIPTTHQKRDENLQRIIKLYNKLTSKRIRRNNDDDEEEEEDDDGDGDEDEGNGNGNGRSEYDDVQEISDFDHPCYGTELIERQTCGVKNKQCEGDLYGMPPFCLETPPRRRCREAPENRWYYNARKKVCGIFTYTGCKNDNNFAEEELCMQTCARQIMSNDLDSLSLISERFLGEKVDCKVSHWKHEVCNATCGEEGFRWKYRSIIQHPQNGGLPCPRTMVHIERCSKDCGHSKVISTSQVGNSINPHHQHQCRYSNWSAWSPCSKSCGDYAVQIRTRTVLSHPTHTHLCNERLEERRCEVMPCLVGNGYNYNYNYRS